MLIAAAGYCLCAASALAVDRRSGDLRIGASAGSGREAAELEGGRRRGGPFSQLGEGFARIRRSAELKALIAISMTRNVFVGFAPALLILVATGRLGRPSADYGILATASAAGALAGSLAGPLAARALPKGWAGYLGLGLHFASLAALGLLSSFPIAVATLAAGSFALYAAAIELHSRRDAATELATRGRVYGANTTIQTIPSLLSLAAASLLADRFGAGPVFLAGGLAALIALAIAFAIARDAGGLSTARDPAQS
jgi:Na+/melibiose symporter-like transporter